MLCTIADLKLHLGVGAEFNDLLTFIVAGVSATFDRETRRVLLATEADVVETMTGSGPYLQLRRYPVVGITSVKEALDWDFDNVEALVTDLDYRLINGGLKGVLYRVNSCWPVMPDSVQIAYRGGYLPAGESPEEGDDISIVLPADLREAAILHSCLLFKRRDDIGLSGQSFQGGSMNVFSRLDFEPQVKQILDAYTRVSL